MGTVHTPMKRDMPWLLFLLGLSAFCCSVFVWHISVNLEEAHFDDINIPLPIALLLSCTLFCLGLSLHPRYIREGMLIPKNRKLLTAAAIPPRMEENILTTILIPLLRYAADALGSTILLALAFTILMV